MSSLRLNKEGAFLVTNDAAELFQNTWKREATEKTHVSAKNNDSQQQSYTNFVLYNIVRFSSDHIF
jgi:hypothetical protein